MIKTLSLTAVVIVLGCMPSSAQTPSNSGWAFSNFKSATVEIGVATDKAGHRMHVMRLKDGSIMAMVPASPLWALMKDTPDDMLQQRQTRRTCADVRIADRGVIDGHNLG